jgi:AcrR family transcriptional regulator
MLAGVSPGLRERKKLETRSALARAAVELVVERGSSVTVEDIAAAAGVSARTFFNYFPTKEHAITGADPEAAVRIRVAVLAARPGTPTLEVLRRALRDEAAAVEGERELTLLRMRAVRADPQLQGHLVGTAGRDERSVVEAVAQRLGIEPDGYPSLVVGVAWAAMRVCVVRWAAAGGSVPLADLVDEAFAAIVTGLPDPD